MFVGVVFILAILDLENAAGHKHLLSQNAAERMLQHLSDQKNLILRSIPQTKQSFLLPGILNRNLDISQLRKFFDNSEFHSDNCQLQLPQELIYLQNQLKSDSCMKNEQTCESFLQIALEGLQDGSLAATPKLISLLLRLVKPPLDTPDAITLMNNVANIISQKTPNTVPYFNIGRRWDFTTNIVVGILDQGYWKDYETNQLFQLLSVNSIQPAKLANILEIVKADSYPNDLIPSRNVLIEGVLAGEINVQLPVGWRNKYDSLLAFITTLLSLPTEHPYTSHVHKLYPFVRLRYLSDMGYQFIPRGMGDITFLLNSFLGTRPQELLQRILFEFQNIPWQKQLEGLNFSVYSNPRALFLDMLRFIEARMKDGHVSQLFNYFIDAEREQQRFPFTRPIFITMEFKCVDTILIDPKSLTEIIERGRKSCHLVKLINKSTILATKYPYPTRIAVLNALIKDLEPMKYNAIMGQVTLNEKRMHPPITITRCLPNYQSNLFGPDHPPRPPMDLLHQPRFPSAVLSGPPMYPLTMPSTEAIRIPPKMSSENVIYTPHYPPVEPSMGNYQEPRYPPARPLELPSEHYPLTDFNYEPRLPTVKGVENSFIPPIIPPIPDPQSIHGPQHSSDDLFMLSNRPPPMTSSEMTFIPQFPPSENLHYEPPIHINPSLPDRANQHYPSENHHFESSLKPERFPLMDFPLNIHTRPGHELAPINTPGWPLDPPPPMVNHPPMSEQFPLNQRPTCKTIRIINQQSLVDIIDDENRHIYENIIYSNPIFFNLYGHIPTRKEILFTLFRDLLNSGKVPIKLASHFLPAALNLIQTKGDGLLPPILDEVCENNLLHEPRQIHEIEELFIQEPNIQCTAEKNINPFSLLRTLTSFANIKLFQHLLLADPINAYEYDYFVTKSEVLKMVLMKRLQDSNYLRFGYGNVPMAAVDEHLLKMILDGLPFNSHAREPVDFYPMCPTAPLPVQVYPHDPTAAVLNAKDVFCKSILNPFNPWSSILPLLHSMTPPSPPFVSETWPSNSFPNQILPSAPNTRDMNSQVSLSPSFHNSRPVSYPSFSPKSPAFQTMLPSKQTLCDQRTNSPTFSPLDCTSDGPGPKVIPPASLLPPIEGMQYPNFPLMPYATNKKPQRHTSPSPRVPFSPFPTSDPLPITLNPSISANSLIAGMVPGLGEQQVPCENSTLPPTGTLPSVVLPTKVSDNAFPTPQAVINSKHPPTLLSKPPEEVPTSFLNSSNPVSTSSNSSISKIMPQQTSTNGDGSSPSAIPSAVSITPNASTDKVIPPSTNMKPKEEGLHSLPPSQVPRPLLQQLPPLPQPAASHFDESCEVPPSKFLLMRPLSRRTCVDAKSLHKTNPVQMISLSELFNGAKGSQQAIDALKRQFAGKAVYAAFQNVDIENQETKMDLIMAIAQQAGIRLNIEPSRDLLRVTSVCSKKLRESLPPGDIKGIHLQEIGCRCPIKRALMNAMLTGYNLL